MPPLEATICGNMFPEASVIELLETSFSPSCRNRLWWLKMLNPSARNSRLTRSWIGKVFESAASRFQSPGPRKALRADIVDGHGPQSEIPSGKSGGFRFGFAQEVAA